jgi:phosphoribosylanthranilate isomerase
MHNIFVKICGITNKKDALFACKCGTDALGFIAYPKSKRYINCNETKKIIKNINVCYADVLKVGVFVNETVENIKMYIDAGINIVQLHGDETAEYINKIKKLNGSAQIWKAVRLKEKNEIDNVKGLDVDKFLIDTYSVDEYGGTGETGDWELAKYAVLCLDKPVMLAGGLSPENIKDAIEFVKPYGVDLSSGVEVSPGCKDHKLISELFKNIICL